MSSSDLRVLVRSTFKNLSSSIIRQTTYTEVLLQFCLADAMHFFVDYEEEVMTKKMK